MRIERRERERQKEQNVSRIDLLLQWREDAICFPLVNHVVEHEKESEGREEKNRAMPITDQLPTCILLDFLFTMVMIDGNCLLSTSEDQDRPVIRISVAKSFGQMNTRIWSDLEMQLNDWSAASGKSRLFSQQFMSERILFNKRTSENVSKRLKFSIRDRLLLLHHHHQPLGERRRSLLFFMVPSRMVESPVVFSQRTFFN